MNPYLTVEANMTPAEKERLLALFNERNPHLRGAAIADILEMHDESDALCGEIEAASDRSLEDVPHDLRRVALMTAIMVHPDDVLAVALRLAGKGGG